MLDSSIWFVLAGLMIVAELFTGTFYLLMIAIGLAAGGLVGILGGKLEWQLLCAAAVGFIAMVLLRRSRFGKSHKHRATRDPNILLDIGQVVQVDHWEEHNGVYTARVKYRGAEWDVELEHPDSVHAGQFIIRAIRGSRLIVAVQ